MPNFQTVDSDTGITAPTRIELIDLHRLPPRYVSGPVPHLWFRFTVQLADGTRKPIQTICRGANADLQAIVDALHQLLQHVNATLVRVEMMAFMFFPGATSPGSMECTSVSSCLRLAPPSCIWTYRSAYHTHSAGVCSDASPRICLGLEHLSNLSSNVGDGRQPSVLSDLNVLQRHRIIKNWWCPTRQTRPMVTKCKWTTGKSS